MTISELGLPTHHTRVERWECDYNNHWNTRYYARSFQLAAETIAARADGSSPGAGVVKTRHIRFMGELFTNASVEVRSAVVQGGRYDGAMLHLLSSGGRVATSALDWPGAGAGHLPKVAAADLGDVLPRGLDMVPDDLWRSDLPEELAELGAVRPAELDHTGALEFDQVLRRFAIAVHNHMARLGFTLDFTDRTGINRMTVEMRLTLERPIPAGMLLRGRSRLAAVGGKSFATAHRLETMSGELLATMEQNLLAVDLKARKSVEVPEFLRRLT